jgi:hypothetical protein
MLILVERSEGQTSEIAREGIASVPSVIRNPDKDPMVVATAFGLLCHGMTARWGASPLGRGVALKRVAIFQIRSPRFKSLILRMSLSRNRCPLSGDML